jgi:hypothetical protein
VLTIHDWLAFLSGEPFLWDQYDTTLWTIVEKRASAAPLQATWMGEVVGKPQSPKTLLYRHYLLSDVVGGDINSDITAPLLHQLIASTLLSEVSFGSGGPFDLWDGILEDSQPINQLRRQQSGIKAHLHDIAMREHHHPSQYLADHGDLFAFSLLYGLYLTHVTLIFEAATEPHPALLTITDCLQDTVTHLKGALCHGPSQWQ